MRSSSSRLRRPNDRSRTWPPRCGTLSGSRSRATLSSPRPAHGRTRHDRRRAALPPASELPARSAPARDRGRRRGARARRHRDRLPDDPRRRRLRAPLRARRARVARHPRLRAPLPRARHRPRRRSRRPRGDRPVPGLSPCASTLPCSRRTSSRRHRSRDGAPRRTGRAPRRVRTRGDPRCDELLAAGDERLRRVAARHLARARARRAGRPRRRLDRARPPALRRRRARLPVRGGRARPHRPLAAAPPVPPDSADRPRPRPPLAPLRPRRVGRLLRAAFGCPRRGSPAGDRRTRDRSSKSRWTRLLIGIPQTTPILPRERPNPLLAATTGLGLALRLWRERFPLREDGTAILLHGFERHFAHPTQQPYRAFFQATRVGRDPELLAGAERVGRR